MTINNPEIYDSVLAGVAASNGAWINDVNPIRYASDLNAAKIIAREVDQAIPTIVNGPTLSQRQLVESITKSVMTGRAASSTNPSDYTLLAESIAAQFSEFSSGLQNSPNTNYIIFTPTGTNDQSTLNIIMAINSLLVSPKTIIIGGGTFDVNVDSIIPSGTILEINPNTVFTGSFCPFALDKISTTLLGIMTTPNTQNNNTFSSSVSIPVNTRIGIELTSTYPNNNALVRLQYIVTKVTGASTPFTIEVDDIIPVSFPSANIVKINSSVNNVQIIGNGCSLNTLTHIRAIYARNCWIENFSGNNAIAINELIGCLGVIIDHIDDMITIFFAASRNTHSYYCNVNGVIGPGFVMDDCVRCTQEYAKSRNCMNGCIMGTNLISTAGASGGSYKSHYIECESYDNTIDGFDIENSCCECDLIRPTSEGCSNAGFYVGAGWAGIGPANCNIIEPHSANNSYHIIMDSGGSTPAYGTKVSDVVFIGQTLTSIVNHESKITGGNHEGGIEIKNGTFNFEIASMKRIESALWGISADGNTVGIIDIHDCPNIKANGTSQAALLTGSNNKILLHNTNLFSDTGPSINYAGTNTTIRETGRCFIGSGSAITNLANNFFSRASAQLSGGSIAVSWPDLQICDRVNVSLSSVSGTLGIHYQVTQTPGTGFSIYSLSVAGALVTTDASTLFYNVN